MSDATANKMNTQPPVMVTVEQTYAVSDVQRVEGRQ